MSAPPRRPERSATSILLQDVNQHLTLMPIRLRDRLLARIFAHTLDSALAEGKPIESDRLRAVRAAMLVSPADRQRLAGTWSALVKQLHAEPQPAFMSSRIPPQRDQVRDAAESIELLATALRSPRPVSARGAAMARMLLVDGGGPLYAARNDGDLAEAVITAALELDSVQL